MHNVLMVFNMSLKIAYISGKENRSEDVIRSKFKHRKSQSRVKTWPVEQFE